MIRLASRTSLAAFVLGGLMAALVGAVPALALQEFGDQIPNLDAAGGCDGLCHADGFTSSQLYIDFAAHGMVWNAAFANEDSDGDGFSNGWELQNPSGTWVSGTPYPGNAALVSNPTLSNARPPLPVATDPTSITHAEAAGQNGSVGFAVKNVGGVPFDYTLTPGQTDTWMMPDPSSMQALPPNEQDAILLMFATNGLADGLYQGNLTLAIPGIRADRIPMIGVGLTVPEPGAIAAGAAACLGLVRLARRRARRDCTARE